MRFDLSKCGYHYKISKGAAVSVVRDSEGAWKVLGYTIF